MATSLSSLGVTADMDVSAYTAGDLVVSEDWRGKGVGRRLIAITVEAAKKGGLTSLHLDTDRPAVAFYRPLGFTPIVETRLCQLRAGEHMPAHDRMALPVG